MKSILMKIFGCLREQKCTVTPFEPSLQNMPDVVMKQILNELDFRSILNLRKVSHNFRDFIDNVKPPSFLTSISINVQSEMISFELIFPAGPKSFHGSQMFYVEFKTHSEGCAVQWFNKRKLMKKILENRHFVETALQDFQVLMKHQRSILSMFRLEFEYCKQSINQVDHDLDPIADMVLTRIEALKKLQVEDLSMSVIRQEQVMPVLSIIDPNSLRKIKIYGKKSFPMDAFEVDKLETLEQWKSAKELKLWRYNMSIPMEKFTHFQTVQLFFQTIPAEQILNLKRIFLSLPCNIKSCSLKYKFIDDLPLLTDSLGPFVEETDQYGVSEKRWIFKIEESMKVVSISMLSSGFITLEQVERSQISARIRPLN